MNQLPSDIIPESRWEIVTPELKRTKMYEGIRSAWLDAVLKPGWNPRTVQLGGFLRAIDYAGHDHWRRNDDFGDVIDHTHPHSYKVAIISDHPLLAKLPKNAPRSVRHMLRADNRLRWLRAKDVSDFLQCHHRATADWQIYLEQAGMTGKLENEQLMGAKE